jgi:hypothetical protein
MSSYLLLDNNQVKRFTKKTFYVRNNTKYLFRIEGSANFELGDEIEMTINISRASIFDKMSEERI